MEIWIIVGIVVILAVVFVVIYNRLVRLRNGYRNAFSQIDVQMKRRHDLIPNLVETVKGYAKHERETLEAVIAARNQAEKIREKLAGAVGDAQSGAQQVVERVVVFVPDQGKLVTRFRCGSG